MMHVLVLPPSESRSSRVSLLSLRTTTKMHEMSSTVNPCVRSWLVLLDNAVGRLLLLLRCIVYGELSAPLI